MEVNVRAATLAELIYQVRGAIAECGRKVPLAKDSMTRAERELVDLARSAGLDPGKTADDADALKLVLISRDGGQPRGEPTLPTPEPRAGADEVAACLEEAARVSGAEYTVHRVVGRWSEFVQRAVFGLRDGKALIPDDPEVPVAEWVREHDVDTSDVTALARAFVDWTREVCERFEREQLG